MTRRFVIRGDRVAEYLGVICAIVLASSDKALGAIVVLLIIALGVLSDIRRAVEGKEG